MSTQAIRFYERSGLLPPTSRSANGYRDYEPASLDRLRFIRAAQAAGLRLADIRPVLGIRDDGRRPCGEVVELLERRLDEVRRQRAALAALEDDLERLLVRGRALDPAHCTGDDVCHVIGGPGGAMRGRGPVRASAQGAHL